MNTHRKEKESKGDRVMQKTIRNIKRRGFTTRHLVSTIMFFFGTEQNKSCGLCCKMKTWKMRRGWLKNSLFFYAMEIELTPGLDMLSIMDGDCLPNYISCFCRLGRDFHILKKNILFPSSSIDVVSQNPLL